MAVELKSILTSLLNKPNVSLAELIDAVNINQNVGAQIMIAQPAFTREQGQTFKRFDSDRLVRGSRQTVTSGLWSNGMGSLNSVYLKASQTGSNSGYYYFDAYDQNPATSPDSAEVQFSVAYGHISGGGSPSLAVDDDSTQSTKSVYAQIRNIVGGLVNEPLDFNQTPSNDVYVVSIARGRMKEKLDPGNWELHLSGSSGLIKLIDDSGREPAESAPGRAGQVYNIVSGSLNTGAGTGPTYGVGNTSYGKFYPDCGLYLFSPSLLATALGSALTPDESTNGYKYNQRKLFDAISLGAEFQARNVEEVSSTYYYVNVGNQEFNLSNNPTYFNAKTGELKKESFFGNPKVYITTVGLYDDNNDLIAVAKLSKPIRKHFGNEVNIQVRLDF